jgi:NADH-quinone oxidoreductase subunit J
VSLEELAFLALALVAVVTALAALLVRELVHTILWIAMFFVDLAAIYFLLDAPFLGVLQLGVYAGAVTILLLFGIMVTRKRIFAREAATGIGPVPLALAIVTFIFLISALGELPQSETAVASYDPTALSVNLFGPNGAWLLLLGLIMLAGVSGAIYLVREGRD